MKLTRQQQQTITDSLWVVNTALQKQGMARDEDLRQSAILYMCQCIQRFDNSKGVKWTTYAYKNVSLFIHKELQKRKIESAVIAQDDLLTATESFTDTKLMEDEFLVTGEIFGHCSPRERRILELKKQGYRWCEISEIIGCCPNQVYNYVQSIREKTKGIMR